MVEECFDKRHFVPLETLRAPPGHEQAFQRIQLRRIYLNWNGCCVCSRFIKRADLAQCTGQPSMRHWVKHKHKLKLQVLKVLHRTADLAKTTEHKSWSLRCSSRWRQRCLSLRNFWQRFLNCARDWLSLIENGKVFQRLQLEKLRLFLNISVCMICVWYGMWHCMDCVAFIMFKFKPTSQTVCSQIVSTFIHKRWFVKINTKIDRKPVYFFQQVSEIGLKVVEHELSNIFLQL